MKDKLVLMGGGGHAKVVLDILLQMDCYDIVGVLDPEYKRVGNILGVKLIGDDSLLEQLMAEGVTHAFVGIGSNRIRKKLFKKCVACGYEVPNAISPQCVISPFAVLGRGDVLMPGAVVNVETRLGDNCIINTNASIDHECVIGDHAHVAPGCALSGKVILGEGAFLGTGTRVKDGITVGGWSVVGAGAAVVRDLPCGVMAYGVPARVIRNIEEGKTSG